MTDALNPPQPPTRAYYSTGRMLGVEDFQAEQDYHRGRLARTLLQLLDTGTVAGLFVQTDANTDVTKLEIQVTPGMAVDRVGRIIEVPRTVCIVLQNWLNQYMQAWQAQQKGNAPGTTSIADPNTAIHDGAHLMVDVFVTFVACTSGLTPTFATQDDYDATDAFSPNRLLDSFAMQLVLRTDATHKTPLDPWASLGATPTVSTLRSAILSGTLGPSGTPAEYPPNFDATAVYLARILVPATAGTGGNPPTWTLTGFTTANNIDNLSRLFVIPPSIVARWNWLGSGTES